jgi:glycosyltransferase involved in cell wall biosynthesis
MQKTKLKVLELCQFSAGICGVWSRVREESERLSKLSYEIRIFSSNATKGSEEIACSEENIESLKIRRFPFRKLGGESFMKWDFEKEALEYSPDIIIAHNYRHLHTTKALKLAKALREQGKKCKVFLVTHAPFVPDNSTRSFAAKLVVNFYDRFIGRRVLNQFDKIITISKWEVPHIIAAGARKEKLVYIPNGIPEEFFKLKKLAKEENKLLFLGRVSPIKNLETAIKALKLIKDSRIILEFVGPAEESYKNNLLKMIKSESLENRIIFSSPIYDLKKKIAKIDSCKIFLLPSKKEGMPQSLIEAMARGKIAIGSDIPAIADLITDGKNGYLFKFDNPQDLAEKINKALKNKKIGKKARKSVEKYNWNNIILQIEKLF